MLFNGLQNKKGFTLIETLVGTAVFLVIAVSAYRAFTSLFQLVTLNQYRAIALNLSNEQFEIIRNLPYSDVGVTGSIPNGKIEHIQTLTRSNIPFTVTTTIRNVDMLFDGTIGGTPNDLAPADNKIVEIEINCSTCINFTPVVTTTQVAPKNLESASTNGALFIKVFDANGVPVADANVHVVNSSVTPNIIIDDVTNNNGMLQLVDVPPATEAYQITVSKPGYSTDRTYTSGASGNPNPTKPHATVLLQQVTQISFAIDYLSSVNFLSVTPTCDPVANFSYQMVGAKMIGVNVPKSSNSYTTSGLGAKSISGVEWDAYTINGTDSVYDLIGLNPLNPISVNPSTTQSISLIVATKNSRSLLVTVKDSATQLPLTDAVVTLSASGYDEELTTGRGFLSQTDWSGGAGQATTTNSTKYWFSDGNIETGIPAGELALKKPFGNYVASGYLESSIFDTGSDSNFHHLLWNPTDQPTSTGANSLRFQVATNATSATTTWNYKGPDGTAATYYSSSDNMIGNVHDNDRFIRYMAYLQTANSSSTPNVSDVSFTFTSQCTPPGQVVFTGLSSGAYTVVVARQGYSTTTTNVTINSSWREQVVVMTPIP